MDDLSKLFKKAEKDRTKGRYTKALNYYSRYIERDRSNALVWSGLAYIYNKKELFEESIGASKRALKINEKLESAFDNLFFSYDQTFAYDSAFKILKRYLRARWNSNDLLSEKQFNLKHYALYKELRFRGILIEPRYTSLSGKKRATKRSSIIKVDPEDLGLGDGITPGEILRALSKEIGAEIGESSFKYPNLGGQLRVIELEPFTETNVSKIFIENNIEFHILTFFDFSNIGKTERIIRVLKLLLRYFPFKSEIWERLSDVYEEYGQKHYRLK